MFFITIQFGILVPIDYSIFLHDFVPVLGGHKKVLDGFVSLEVYLDPHLATNIFEAFA